MAKTNAELLAERFNERFVQPIAGAVQGAMDFTAAQREAAQGAAARQAAALGLPPPVVAQPRLTESPGSPPPAIGATLNFTPGGPTVSLPAPAAAAARAVRLPQPARAPAAPRTPSTPKAAGAPASPQVLSTGPAPLPYGFRDQADAIAAGIRQQGIYRDEGLAAIQALAARGDPGNYSYRLAALTGALGTNNFAGVQQQGVEALNRALGDMQQTELQTETARANALTSASAQLGAANIGAGAQRYGDNLAMERFYRTAQAFGEDQVQVKDPLTGLMTTQSRAVRGVPLRQGGFQELKPGLAPNGTQMTSKGKTYVMENGTWKPVK